MQLLLLGLRKKANLTQADLAKLIGVSLDSYRDKENGSSPFKSDEMFIISEFFEKPMEQIFLPRNVCNTEFIVTELKKKMNDKQKS